MNAVRIILLLLFSATLAVAAHPSLTLNWSVNLGGDMVDVKDPDHDGRPDIVLGMFREQGSYAYLLNQNGVLQWRNKISVIWPQNSPRTLVVDDIDGNNKTDIVVGTVVESKEACDAAGLEYAHPIFRVERDPRFENNAFLWAHRGYGYSMAMVDADLNGDEKKELISGSRDGIVYAIKPDGNLLWKYKTDGTVNDVKASDIDRDGRPEVIAATYTGMYAIKGTGNKIWSSKTESALSGVAAGNINKDPQEELFAATEDGRLLAYTVNGDKLWEYKLSAIKPYIVVTDLSRTNSTEIIVSESGTLHALDGKGNATWTLDVGYPITGLYAAKLTEELTPTLLVLGARNLRAYIINQDYLYENEAQASLEKAKSLYRSGIFDKSYEKAARAAELYGRLNNTELEAEAYTLQNRSRLQTEAGEIIIQAKAIYEKGDYKTARNLASQAEKMYLQAEDRQRAQDALKSASMAIDQADAQYFYDRAQDYYRSQNYLEGGVYGEKALTLYTSLNNKEGMERTAKLINNSNEYPKADRSIAEAARLTGYGNYSGAKIQAEAALRSYTLIGDEAKTNQTEKLLVDINRWLTIVTAQDEAEARMEAAKARKNETNYKECMVAAGEAAEKYRTATDQEGETAALNINQSCAKGLEAHRNFAKANEYFANLEYEAARDYAAKARQQYRDIEDVDGALKTTDIIQEIQAEQNKTQNPPKKEEGIPTTYILAAAALGILIIIAAAAAALILLRRRSREVQMPVKDAALEQEEKRIQDYLNQLPEEQTPQKEEPPQIEIIAPAPKKEPEPPKTPETHPADRLDEVLRQAGLTTQAPETQPPTPEKPTETDEEIQLAEKIKKDLAAINKKLQREK